MFTVNAVGDDVMTQANAIRDQAETDYTRVRSDGRYNTTTIQALLAAAYVKASQQMTALQTRHGADAKATRLRATQAVFGVEDLVSASGGNRADISISYRDAQDRVASISRPDEAALLLTRATEQGDELLARAVALRAWDEVQSGSGSALWGPLLDQYTSTRPVAATALARLVEAQATLRTPQAVDMFGFVLMPPLELAGLQAFQIEALADTATP